GGVAGDDLQRCAGDAKVDVAGDCAGGGTAILRIGLSKESEQDFAVDDNLELLGGIVGPHVHHVQVRLDLHDVIEDEVEILTFVDRQLDEVRARALDFQQT